MSAYHLSLESLAPSYLLNVINKRILQSSISCKSIWAPNREAKPAGLCVPLKYKRGSVSGRTVGAWVHSTHARTHAHAVVLLCWALQFSYLIDQGSWERGSSLSVSYGRSMVPLRGPLPWIRSVVSYNEPILESLFNHDLKNWENGSGEQWPAAMPADPNTVYEGTKPIKSSTWAINVCINVGVNPANLSLLSLNVWP